MDRYRIAGAATYSEGTMKASTNAHADAQPAGKNVHAGNPCEPTAGTGVDLIHPLWLRTTHWLNALAAIIMILSGWRIYDASPVFKGFMIPLQLTLGGW